MKQLTKKELKKQSKELHLKREHEIVLIMENIQYARNVASMFRTADAAGVRKIYLTGISKQPPFGKELQQVSRHKEKSVYWEYETNTNKVITKLKKEGFWICAIELADKSFPLDQLPEKIADKTKICFIAGNETYGVVNKTLENTDTAVFIPMYGKGASINVSNAAAVVLFSI